MKADYQNTRKALGELTRLACVLGAIDAAVISTEEISMGTVSGLVLIC